MAIIVEQEKRHSGMFAAGGWVVLLIAIAAAAYYVFFAPAPAVTAPGEGGLSSIAPLVQSGVQPSAVEGSPVLVSLHTTIAAPTSTGPAAVGRTNPFIAP